MSLLILNIECSTSQINNICEYYIILAVLNKSDTYVYFKNIHIPYEYCLLRKIVVCISSITLWLSE
jgi:hypothetical protein